ncbi:hypothetical protein SAY87_003919 [Trapa incisa]|uniref:NAC domain-containing protein n=1 Tax=Trapa incisa TaxID=236973 RepID=A0AAN7PJ45_9MYRT|nr:hypothetical protein SAY87_003919 [Trapa incisa]
MKKTLVFYGGRAPKGEKTNWVMHEYRLDGRPLQHNLPKTAGNEWVISRVFEKTMGRKKTHISSLARADEYLTGEAGYSLPPLMDDAPPQSMTNAVPAIHVPCQSAPALRNKEETTDSISVNTNHTASSSNIPIAPIIRSFYSPHPTDYRAKVPFSGQVLMQERSVLRAILESPSMKMEMQEMLAASQGMGVAEGMADHPEMGSAMMPRIELNRRVTFHDQREQQPPPPSCTPGPAGLDFIWNF